MDIILVTGPPCGGKTTFALKQKAKNDIIIDADKLAEALGSPASHDHPGHIKALAAKLRDVAIRDATRQGHRAWVVSSSPTAEKHIPYTRTYCRDPGKDVCLGRAKKSRPAWTLAAIEDWYNKREEPINSVTAIQW